MNRHSSFLRDAVLRGAKYTRLRVTGLYKAYQEKIGSLYRHFDDACYRFWKYPIPRRVQRVYDMACLHGKLLPRHLSVLRAELRVFRTELRILLSKRFRIFILIHSYRWEPNDKLRHAAKNQRCEHGK